MTAYAAPPATPGPTPRALAPRRGWARLGRVVSWALVLGWVACLVGAAVTSERRSDLDHLRQAIASGTVSEVRAAGGLSPTEIGRSSVRLEWTEHGLRHVTTVTQAQGVTRGGAGSPDAAPRVRGDLGAYLARYGDVRVEQVERDRGGGLEADLLGWRVTGATASAFALLLLLTLGALVAAPEPWRATRWAWAWLFLAVPGLVPPLYLLLGGPTGLARPRPGSRRLTGGWAFLLLLLSGALLVA